MIITIHRGTHQIGGCITEITTDTTKILIDFGEELMPQTPIDEGEILRGCDAVFITHYHSDHVGLHTHIPPHIPIYLGKVAKQILVELTARTNKENLYKVERFRTYTPMQSIKVGDIEVRPLLVDHSAFDAYMFLIKAEGKTLLHTGDFRGHGFRGKGLMPTLQKYVGKVDALIIEGTTLYRDGGEAKTERALQLQAATLMKEKKYVFVLCSSTNIDRIASLYHANPFGRYFLCDAYQKAVLKIVRENVGPRSSLYDLQKIVTYGPNIEDRFFKRGFCMLVRNRDDHRRIIDKYPEDERLILYSIWKGYVEGKHKSERMIRFLDGLHYTYLHTSGYADAETICEVVSAVSPDVIYPIHTENAAWFKGRFGRVEVKT
ncbi:MAG: MBL fold metallo-hydrolase [Clostridiaceae bacterium]|nr:MBL fold metallo-hydrolase [Clostridiaceae bacterium]